ESCPSCRRRRRSTTISSFRCDSDASASRLASNSSPTDCGGVGDMLAQERRRRLLGAMANAAIEHGVLYGNAWQGDDLRYATDFGILEGHGLALVSSDGTTELFLDSATEAERAESEAPENKIYVAADIARAVAARLDRVANHRL